MGLTVRLLATGVTAGVDCARNDGARTGADLDRAGRRFVHFASSELLAGSRSHRGAGRDAHRAHAG